MKAIKCAVSEWFNEGLLLHFTCATFNIHVPWAGSIRQRVWVDMRGGRLRLVSISLLLLGCLFLLLHSVRDQVIWSTSPQSPANSQPPVLQWKRLGRWLAGDQRLGGGIDVLLFTAIPVVSINTNFRISALHISSTCSVRTHKDSWCDSTGDEPWRNLNGTKRFSNFALCSSPALLHR